MSFTTSFTFSDAFRDVLKAVSVKNGKSQTKLIEEAVSQFSAGAMPESVLLEKIDTITGQNAALMDEFKKKMDGIEKSLTNVQVLLIQIIENQQKNKPVSKPGDLPFPE